MSDSNENRLNANRANAQLSTGPRTQEGKARVKYNALRHGLLSQKVLFIDEEAGKYRRFAEQIRLEIDPLGAIEELLTERIITSAWRLRRCLDIESKASDNNRFGPDDLTGLRTFLDVGMGYIRDGHGSDAIARLSRYETTIERSLFKAMHELERVQARRRGVDVPVPAALDLVLTSDAEQDAP